jgi:hypothetical protein
LQFRMGDAQDAEEATRIAMAVYLATPRAPHRAIVRGCPRRSRPSQRGERFRSADSRAPRAAQAGDVSWRRRKPPGGGLGRDRDERDGDRARAAGSQAPDALLPLIRAAPVARRIWICRRSLLKRLLTAGRFGYWNGAGTTGGF